mmetsp:Transcript_4565/g.12117  ORF Transcript_4565/g.12117 Transcript_4565/m.12117 type:complete len:268 (+) Transcript_4565:281-1084(+)
MQTRSGGARRIHLSLWSHHSKLQLLLGHMHPVGVPRSAIRPICDHVTKDYNSISHCKWSAWKQPSKYDMETSMQALHSKRRCASSGASLRLNGFHWGQVHFDRLLPLEKPGRCLARPPRQCQSVRPSGRTQEQGKEERHAGDNPIGHVLCPQVLTHAIKQHITRRPQECGRCIHRALSIQGSGRLKAENVAPDATKDGCHEPRADTNSPLPSLLHANVCADDCRGGHTDGVGPQERQVGILEACAHDRRPQHEDGHGSPNAQMEVCR